MNEEFKAVELNENEMAEAAGGARQARWISYTIVRGDTITKIANRYHVTKSQLIQWNNIADLDKIVAGHKLRIYTSI